MVVQNNLIVLPAYLPMICSIVALVCCVVGLAQLRNNLITSSRPKIVTVLAIALLAPPILNIISIPIGWKTLLSLAEWSLTYVLLVTVQIGSPFVLILFAVNLLRMRKIAVPLGIVYWLSSIGLFIYAILLTRITLQPHAVGFFLWYTLVYGVVVAYCYKLYRKGVLK